jgi:hypothetical protein
MGKKIVKSIAELCEDKDAYCQSGYIRMKDLMNRSGPMTDETFMDTQEGEKGWLEKLGIKEDDVVFVSFYNVAADDYCLKLEGYELFAEMDDYTVIVYKDGKLIGGYYCSTRGCAYHANCWIGNTDPEQFLGAVSWDDEKEGVKAHTWFKTTSDIAKDLAIDHQNRVVNPLR